MLKGQRTFGEYDPIRGLAIALLLHSVNEANKGVLWERCWLMHDPMAELCFDVLELNAQLMREMLVERWQVCRLEGVTPLRQAQGTTGSGGDWTCLNTYRQ